MAVAFEASKEIEFRRDLFVSHMLKKRENPVEKQRSDRIFRVSFLSHLYWK
jgi:hypothetical protein